MAGSAQIGNLAVNLSLETAAFNRGARQAEARAKGLRGSLAGLGGTMKSFAGGLAGGLGIGLVTSGLTAVATGAFEMGSELSEAAEKLGVTVEGLQRLRVAARESGITSEQLDGAMTRLNKSLGDLQLGSKAATTAFAAIGLSADDLRGKRPDEALRLIADALNKLPDVQQRIAIGSQLMGRGFAELLPLINGGSAALDKYAEQSQRSGEITDANAKKLDELADRWEGLKATVGVAAANLIANVATLYGKVDGFLHGLGERIDSFDAATARMARNVLASITGMVSGIASAIGDRLNAVWDAAKARIESVRAKFAELYDAVVGNSYIPDMIDGIARSMAELQAIMVDPALSATQKVGAAFQSLAGVVGGLFGQKAGSILGSIGNLVSVLAPLLGKRLPGVITESGASGGRVPIGMARGGGGTFGGRPGIDRNTLSLNGSPIARVSRGETFRVDPANQNGSRVQIVPSPYFDVIVDGRAARVAAPMAATAATAGAAGGISAMQRRSARTFPGR